MVFSINALGDLNESSVKLNSGVFNGTKGGPENLISQVHAHLVSCQHEAVKTALQLPSSAAKRPQDDDHKKHLCLDFMNGRCTRQPCRYYHPPAGEVLPTEPTLRNAAGHPAKVCSVFVLTGFCKFGNKCWYHHPAGTEAQPNPNLAKPLTQKFFGWLKSKLDTQYTIDVSQPASTDATPANPKANDRIGGNLASPLNRLRTFHQQSEKTFYCGVLGDTSGRMSPWTMEVGDAEDHKVYVHQPYAI